MEDILLALDFGGTKHSAGITAPGMHDWMGFKRIISPPNADATSDMQAMLSIAHELLKGSHPVAIGVSFGGPVNTQTGTVRLSHHVPGWANIQLGEFLESTFNAPVSIDNDANVGAIGEHRYGAGRGIDQFMYITVSTGVGGGWILNGEIWHGSGDMAGEIGHTTIDPDGPICLCGNRGCVERFASGPYMAENALEILSTNPHRGEILRAMVNHDLQTLTGKTISQAADLSDEVAIEVLELSAWALGRGIGNAANLINPQRFILGGGVTKSGKHFWDTLRHTAHTIALPEIKFDIVPALLGDDATLWGAIALAHDSLNN